MFAAIRSQPREAPQHEVDDAVRDALGNPLQGTLLAMLSEAPGYPSDMAVGLGIEREFVQSALDALARPELVYAMPGYGESWYSIGGERVCDALDRCTR